MASEWRWDAQRVPAKGTYTIRVNYDSGAAAKEAGPAEFDRFENLASKLVKVPKAELDKKLSES